MESYKQVRIEERERILFVKGKGYCLRKMGKDIWRRG